MSPRSSCQRFRRLAGIAAAVSGLLLSAGWIDEPHREGPTGAETFWRVGIPRPIAVRGGRATFRVPARGPTAQTLVIVSALSRGHGPFRIRLDAHSATDAAVPELADDGARCQPSDDFAPRATDARGPLADTRTDRLPARDRIFHLMVREGDPGTPSNYVAVRGILKGVGRRVQVYVGSEDIDKVLASTLTDLIATFDDCIYPRALAHLGAARDVDGDGRFTVLLSSWLDRLGGGRHAVDGFVKVADLDAMLPTPFGNRCDMMYLNAGLSSGPYLRTVLAHEYMHAVVYTRKTLDQSDGADLGPEEEGWLDEAIAHLAEDDHGFSTTNIDYRVSAFLSNPERYRLVVDDYFAANLFRSHGNRGSTYLFLRWCVDTYGPEVITRLVRSPRRGVSNVEAATGATFADLYRRWSLAMFVSGLDPSDPCRVASAERLPSTDLTARLADRERAGPRYRSIVPGAPADCWDASGTTSHYVIVDGDAAGAVEIDIAGPAEADLQVTALPIGTDPARVTLSIEGSRGRDGHLNVVARVREQNGTPVRLAALSWEPLIPGPRPHSDSRTSGQLDRLGIAASFGTSALPARGGLCSQPIPISSFSTQDAPIVFRIRGTDPLGRRVTAWADLDEIGELTDTGAQTGAAGPDP